MGKSVIAALLILAGAITPLAAAETVSREQDITDLRLGQRIHVDDGMCPQGQIKEVSGAKLNAAGIVKIVRCVPRPGSKR